MSIETALVPPQRAGVSRSPQTITAATSFLRAGSWSTPLLNSTSHSGFCITRDEAVTRLGRLDYLSGIARSAFHFTAMRITEDGKVILFDSSRLFGKE